jgi:hypothetical protein
MAGRWIKPPAQALLERRAREAGGNDLVGRASAAGFDPSTIWWRGDLRGVDPDAGYAFAGPELPVWFSSSPHLGGSFGGFGGAGPALVGAIPDPRTGGYRAEYGTSQLTPHFLRLNTFDFRNPEHVEAAERMAHERGVFGRPYTADYFEGESVVRPGEIAQGGFHAVETPGMVDVIDRLGFNSFFVREFPEAEVYPLAGRVREVLPDRDAAARSFEEQLQVWRQYGNGSQGLMPLLTREGDNWVVEHQDTNNLTDAARSLNVGLLDPTAARYLTAKFDPSKRGSKSLLASAAPLLVGGAGTAMVAGAALGPQQADAAMLKPSGEAVLRAAGSSAEGREAWQAARAAGHGASKESRNARNQTLSRINREFAEGRLTPEERIAAVMAEAPPGAITEVPELASRSDIAHALDVGKLNRGGVVGAGTVIPEGEMVGARLDIPSYRNWDVWTPTVYRKDEPTTYAPAVRLTSATFGGKTQGANTGAQGWRIAAGADKGPYAMVTGAWQTDSPEAIRGRAQEALESSLTPDGEWVQVGMNPERASYFYDRRDLRPVAGADEVLQVGNLVLARNPRYGRVDDPKHAVDIGGRRTYYGMVPPTFAGLGAAGMLYPSSADASTARPESEALAPRSDLLAAAAMRAGAAKGPMDPWWWAPSGLLDYLDNLNYGQHNTASDYVGATLDVAPLPGPPLWR